MVGIEHYGVGVGHLAVERHAGLELAHLLHTAHIFALCDDNRLARLAERFHVYDKLCLVHHRHLALEGLGQVLAVIAVQLHLLLILLHDQTVDDVTVHTCEAALLQLLLQHRHHRHIQLAVQQQHGVALVLGCLDVAVLVVLVRGIEVHELAILVGLVVLDERLVLLIGEMLALDILHQGEVLGTLVEVLLREHAVMDEELQVVPFLLIVLTVVLEGLLQTVGHLLGNIGGDLLHVGIALQIAAAHVQRDVRRVDHAMEQGEEVRNDALHLIGDEHLVAIELYLVALQFDIAVDSREIEDTGEVEREVHVQMDPEHRLLLHGIERAVELLVVLILERRRALCPERLHAVDDIILGSLHFLAVFPFGLLAESHGHGKELAVLVEQLADLHLVEVFGAVVRDMQDDIRSTVLLLCVVNGELGCAVAAPAHGLAAVLIALRDDLHLVRHHERGIESEAEVSDDGVGLVLIFVEEVGHTREGDLIDVLVNLLSRHTQTAVTDRDGLVVLIHTHMDGEVA